MKDDTFSHRSLIENLTLIFYPLASVSDAGRTAERESGKKWNWQNEEYKWW